MTGCGSGASRRDTQPVAVGVDERALSPGKTLLVDGNVELLGHRADVIDVELDQRIGTSVPLVFCIAPPTTSVKNLSCDESRTRPDSFTVSLNRAAEPS